MAKRQAVCHGGMFGPSAPAPMSNQTKELLKVMMEESKLTNFQRRKLNETIKNENALPLRVPPTSSIQDLKQTSFPPPQKVFNMRGVPLSSMKSRDEIAQSGSYDRPQFVPMPTKSLEKEKDRLSNIMAYGEDIKPKTKEQKLKEQRKRLKSVKHIDRFEEIQAEIEERKTFLEEMEKVGQGKNYRPIISSQISQLIREMEVIDVERGKLLQNAIQHT